MNNIKDMLQFDGVAAAEDMTGRSARFDENTGLLALALSVAHNDALSKALASEDDTQYNNKLTNYQRIITSMGFELALRTPFVGQAWGDEPVPDEAQYIYAHRAGMLLIFDTYGGDSVNSAKVYYAHRPHQLSSCHYSSGGWYSAEEWKDSRYPSDMWWFGDHDARVALRHTIRRLHDSGQFLTPWPKPHSTRSSPSVWMCHYMDHKKLDKLGSPEYKEAIRNAEARLHQLPDWVKEMISPVLPVQD